MAAGAPPGQKPAGIARIRNAIQYTQYAGKSVTRRVIRSLEGSSWKLTNGQTKVFCQYSATRTRLLFFKRELIIVHVSTVIPNKKAPGKMPGAFQFLSTHFTYKSYRFPVRLRNLVFLDKNCAFPAQIQIKQHIQWLNVQGNGRLPVYFC